MRPSLLLLGALSWACNGPKDPGGGDSGLVPTDTPAGTTPAGTTSTGTTPPGTTPGGTTPTGTTPTGTAPVDCPDDPPPPYAARVDEDCAEAAATASYRWVVEWEWLENPIHPGFHQVMMTPAVGPLVDTNGDATVDGADAPIVVFTAFDVEYRRAGVVVAVRGDTGETVWSVAAVDGREAYGAAGVAIGDIDGTGPGVFVGGTEGLLALNADGSLRWHADTPVGRQGLPTLVDLEGDGVAEVVYGATVIEANGDIRWTGAGTTGGEFAFNGHAADLDGDGLLEVIAGGTVYEHDGSIRWQHTDDEDLPLDGFTGVADLDADGALEIVLVNEGVHLLEADGTQVWSTAFPEDGGGPPLVADLDGDGALEIGVAFIEGYRTFEADGTERWAHPWGELGGENGAAAFDFDGDGAAEILTVDQENAYVLDGDTRATELLFPAFSSGTLYEYPVPVDVDGDGSVEIVIPSNDYSRFDESVGVRAIGPEAGAWPAARGLWNQHHYWDGAANDDGTVPAVSGIGADLRDGDILRAPPLTRTNLTLGRDTLCLDECDDDIAVLWLPVENTGALPADASTLVVRSGADELVRWPVGVLLPGEMAWAGPLEVTRDAWGGGITATVDADDVLQECLEDDNVADWDAFPCL